MLVARVNLNESDSTAHALIYKVYDSVVVEAISSGGFGGLQGSAYREYRTAIDGGAATNGAGIPELLFPAHYAAARDREIPMSETLLVQDLKKIHTELGRRIVILLDECDVLSNSRIALEVLRNVFMNIDGFMLALAGTNRMFPTFEDVFSPIIRQFKKIAVREFEDFDDTEECVRLPLESVGISLEDAFGPSSDRSSIYELHELTGGRPYEIQLLCHFMFKRVEQGNARYMKFDVDLLEEVRGELEDQSHSNDRNIMNTLKRLTNRKIQWLRIFTQCAASYEELLTLGRLRHICPGTEVEASQALQEFLDQGILRKESDNRVTFSGDQFDQIYARYLAASRHEHIYIDDCSFDTELAFFLRRWSNENFIDLSIVWMWSVEDPTTTVEPLSELQLAIDALHGDTADIARLPDSVVVLYRSLAANQISSVATFIKLSLEAHGTSVALVSQHNSTSHFGHSQEEQDALNSLRQDISALGGQFIYSVHEISIPNALILREKMVSLASKSQKAAFAEVHETLAFELYEDRNYAASLEHIKLAHEILIDANLNTSELSHICTMAAHLSIRCEKYEDAIQWAQLAIAECGGVHGEDSEAARAKMQLLARYDLAVALAASDQITSAKEKFAECSDLIDKSPFSLNMDGYFAVLERVDQESGPRFAAPTDCSELTKAVIRSLQVLADI